MPYKEVSEISRQLTLNRLFAIRLIGRVLGPALYSELLPKIKSSEKKDVEEGSNDDGKLGGKTVVTSQNEKPSKRFKLKLLTKKTKSQ